MRSSILGKLSSITMAPFPSSSGSSVVDGTSSLLAASEFFCSSKAEKMSLRMVSETSAASSGVGVLLATTAGMAVLTVGATVTSAFPDCSSGAGVGVMAVQIWRDGALTGMFWDFFWSSS